MIIDRIPRSSIPRKPFQRFRATLSTPPDSAFMFGIEANADKPLLQLDTGSIYAISAYTFMADTPTELDWVQGLNTGATDDTPRIAFKLAKDRSSTIYPEPIQLTTFKRDADSLMFFKTGSGADFLQATMTGNLYQSDGLIGVDAVTVFFDLLVYQVTDKKWRDKWKHLEPGFFDPSNAG